MGAERIVRRVTVVVPATAAERDAYAGRVPQRAHLARGATDTTPERDEQDEDQRRKERLIAEAVAFVTGRPIKNTNNSNERN
ncbi:hypothetical protein [Kocuria sp. KH4]